MEPTFGLSALPPAVASALRSTYGHHRTPWFEQILADIGDRLRPALGSRFVPLYLTCTGSGGREAICANLVRPSDRILVSGYQFEQLARSWGAEVECLPERSEARDGPPLDAAFIDHVSPLGALADLQAITSHVRARAPEAPIVVDLSVSFGADLWKVDAVDADAILLVPERALMGVPGIAVLAVTDAFMAIVARRRPELAEQPFLFDLIRYHRSAAKRTTPYSPNISSCIALHAALGAIEESGGFEAHWQAHEARASQLRIALAEVGLQRIASEARATNAFTSCYTPADFSAKPVLDALKAAGFGTGWPESEGGPLQIAHAGYFPPDAILRFREAITGAGGTVRRTDRKIPAEYPFTIAASDFAAQAERNATRASSDRKVREKIAASARRVFPEHHAVDEQALGHRTIGFVGAGRIVRRAIALCRARGVRHMIVYTPALGAARSGRGSADADHALQEWIDDDVAVAETLEELFTSAHAVVLLPVVYDDTALHLFGKPAAYRNHGLVSAQLLALAKQAEKLDLLVNAAAREVLVDRAALFEAVADGWLRYYSDEMPDAEDPLLDLDGVRFTGHVGGSCREPQAAVAANTHTILRRLLAGMLGRDETHDEKGQEKNEEDTSYTINVVNGHLLKESATERQRAAVRAIASDKEIRVLLTDPFDVESLGFDRLSHPAVELNVHDVSRDRLTSSQLVETLGRIRPHIVMLRSRTEVDESVASAMTAVDELAFIIRPGVGVDNLHDGMAQLSRDGVQIVNEPYGNSFAVAEMTLHFLMSATETTLLAPGPTNFNRDVFDVVGSYDVVDSAGVCEADQSVARRLGAWLGADGQEAVIFSGPGTSMMEASIASLTMPGTRGLVISHGKFGDRFVEIATARGRACEVLRVPEPQWGGAFSPADVADFLELDRERHPRRENALSFLCFQQNETSSGVTYDQAAIRELVAVARAYNPDMMVIADAISGALAHQLDFDALGLDALFLGSQKALGVSSGLAFGVISDRASAWMLRRSGFAGSLDALVDDPGCDGFLKAFDAAQHVHTISLLRAIVERRQGVFGDTPSIFHLLSTARALDLFEAEGGPDAVASRHAGLASLVRQEVSDLGLETMAQPPYESDSVTVVLLPDDVPASAVRKAMARETAIAVAGAQGDYWKSRMIRIGTLGFVSRTDVVRCLRALRVALRECSPARSSESETVKPGAR